MIEAKFGFLEMRGGQRRSGEITGNRKVPLISAQNLSIKRGPLWLQIMDIKERLIKSFRQSLALSSDAEVETIAYRGIKAWDSLGHMQLVTEIEKEFSIMLETDDILNMNSFDKAVEIVSKYKALGHRT